MSSTKCSGLMSAVGVVVCQVSDENKRVEAQAASNSMTQINQQDVDNMMNVQYLLGSSNSRSVSAPYRVLPGCLPPSCLT